MAISTVALVVLVSVVAPVAAQETLRSHEVVVRRCVSELMTTELTLFANGTVRLREEFEDRRQMLLADLTPDELFEFRERLEDVDLLETESIHDGVDGDWVGQCSIRLRLQGRAERFYRFGTFDSVSLGLKQLDMVVADLEQFARTRAVHGELPRDYRPETGDFVRRRDGAVFEVVGYTIDDRGLELVGLVQPVTIYISFDDFRKVFIALEDDNLLDIEH